jgi:hypothetical protein
MQDRKPDLILASEQDAARYRDEGAFSGLPDALDCLRLHPLAKEQRGKPQGMDHIHLSIGSKHRHLVQWTGRRSDGRHYPIGSVMVILNAADVLYPKRQMSRNA